MNEFAQAVWQTSIEMAPWLLLGAAIAGLLHVLVPRSFMQRHFTGNGGVVKAVLFGVPLPLCSCGVIPAGIGLKRSGADDGAAIGFLIATPQTGVDSVLVSAGMLGWPFALWKLLAAATTGIVGGMWVQKDAASTAATPTEEVHAVSKGWLRDAVGHAMEVLETIYRWLFVGIVISAALTAFLPAGGLATVGLSSTLVATGAALLLSLPLYVCATASVPVAAALVTAGLPLGAALVFLMAGPATNAATIGAVKAAFGKRVVVRYLTTIIVGSVAFALLFDALFASTFVAGGHHHHHQAWWEAGSGIFLLAMVGFFAVRDGWSALGRFRQPANSGAAAYQLEVDGMTCNGCVKKVRHAIEGVPGVVSCEVDLEAGTATVGGGASSPLLEALANAGFRARKSTPG